MADKIRVLIADDSSLMRKKLYEILTSDPDIEVVAVLRNGREAVEAIHLMKPDVVTLDVEMPVMDGLEALGYIMSECPTPCVMISAFTHQGGALTIRALEFGAVDFITKPDGPISRRINAHSREIINKVKAAARIPIDKLKLVWVKRATEVQHLLKKPGGMSKVFIIASSTGGTQALAEVLPTLSSDLPAAVLVVQHMPAGFTKSLSERLNWQSRISVVEAEDQMPINPAQVIIAKGGHHMEVEMSGNTPVVRLNIKPPQLGVRPCANLLMTSAADIFKERTVGVILTGMGSDGTIGAGAIKSRGGLVIAQDEASSIVYGMPKSVVTANLVDKVVSLDQVGNEMEHLADGKK